LHIAQSETVHCLRFSILSTPLCHERSMTKF